MAEISGENVPDAYHNVLCYMRDAAYPEQSRNGDVMVLGQPLTLTIRNPQERVMVDPIRNANPFFHLLEFVWMMAGRRDAEFVGNIVNRMWEYAEPNGKFHGAYGHRWRKYFIDDQIAEAITKLKNNPYDRRVVISMWDPDADFLDKQYNDHPCNTHIYFRVVGDDLDMTVCNRSNDVIWGMLGANACHMTMLHELIATAAGYGVGKYRVFTNNAHVYRDLPNFEAIWNAVDVDTPYRGGGPNIVPILRPGETYPQFIGACSSFCKAPHRINDTGIWFIDKIAFPMYKSYFAKDDYTGALEWAARIEAWDWRLAAKEWLKRNRGQR